LLVPPPIVAASSEITALNDDICALRLLVQKQQHTIDSLKCQLTLVPSFLGLGSADNPAIAPCTVSDGHQPLHSMNPPTPDNAVQSAIPSYASTVSHGVPKKKNALQQMVLSTVEAENRHKVARQKNAVISGLPLSLN
jgi:hypothetical protein